MIFSPFVLYREQFKYISFVLFCQHINLKKIQKSFFAIPIVLFWERCYNRSISKKGEKVRTNKEIVNILKEEKDKQGLSISELARRVNMAKSAVSRYFNYTREFPLNRADDFARVLNITPEYLLGVNENKKDNSTTKQILDSVFSKLDEPRQDKVVAYAKSELDDQNKVVNIKDYTYDYYDNAVSAGTGQYIGTTQRDQVTLPVEFDADYVVPVYGDSMEPEYHDGDYIFIESTVNLNDGEIGVFELYGDTYVKQLILEDDHAYLHSLNKKYKDMKVDADAGSDFRVLGRVVGRYSE
jgi:repressor LexA